MKKAVVSLLLCLAASCVVSTASAQNEAGLYPWSKGENLIRLKLGYYRPGDVGDAKAFGIGMNAVAGKYVLDRLYVGGGLGYTLAEAWEGSGSDRISDSNTTIHVPVPVGYVLPLADNIAVDFSTGPRLNYIVSGNMKRGKDKVKYKDIEGLERFSVSWGIEANVLIRGIGVFVSYDLGLKEDSGNTFGVGLRFGW